MFKNRKCFGRSFFAVLLVAALLIGLLPAFSLPTAAANGVQQKLDLIRTVYTNNSYFTCSGGPCSDWGGADCQLSNIPSRGSLPSGRSVANAIGDGWSCEGFARYCFYFIFGQAFYNCATVSTPSLGDFISMNGGAHFAIYLYEDANYFYVYNSNGDYICGVEYAQKYSKASWSISAIYHANNYDAVNGSSTPVPSYTYSSIKPGNYYLKNKATGKCLSVSYSTDANGQNIDTWTYDPGNESEELIITATSNGYKMRPKCSSSRLVNAWGDSPSSGANVNLYDDVNDSSQWWKFEKVSGGYIIHNVYAPSCVLDLKEGWDVFISTRTGSNSQIWELIPAKHTCNKGKFVYFWSEHPHYNCYECSVCGNVWHDISETRKLENCEQCYPPVVPSVKNTYYFDESYNADGTITVEVGVNTVGCVGIAGGVTFDPDVLECLEIDKTKSAFTTLVGPQQEVGNRNGQLNFAADSSTTANLTGKVPLFTAVFRPKKQTTTTFRGTADSACDKDLNDVSFTANEKTISTVGTPTASFLWGDVDCNGKVDSKDKVLAARYLAKWAVNGGFNKAAADFNKDGDVTSAEVVVLARYLAKWTNLPYPVGQKVS